MIDDEETVLVCSPVAMMTREQAVAGARRRRCHLCGIAIWVSPASPPTTHRWCYFCALKMVEPGDTIEPLTPEQQAELRGKLS